MHSPWSVASRPGFPVWRRPGATWGLVLPQGRIPKLKCYLQERYGQIAQRHIARKAPQNWYRTIDRIDPALTRREKLLIPDIKGDASIVYEGGEALPAS